MWRQAKYLLGALVRLASWPQPKGPPGSVPLHPGALPCGLVTSPLRLALRILFYQTSEHIPVLRAYFRILSQRHLLSAPGRLVL